MVIDLDLPLIKRLKITLNQYVFIYLLSKNKKDLQKLLTYQKITEDDIRHLKTKQILTEESNTENLHLTTEFKNKLSVDDTLFEDFFNLYPTQVTRPDGTKDYLKGNVKRCRELYNKIITNDEEIHRHIVDCLKKDISFKKQQNNMRFMKKMYNWLSQEEWKVIEEIQKEDIKINGQPSYGTEIE